MSNLEIRLKKIDETRNYLLDEIEHVIKWMESIKDFISI